MERARAEYTRGVSILILPASTADSATYTVMSLVVDAGNQGCVASSW